jgi:dsRNA-specific ribonuclease
MFGTDRIKKGKSQYITGNIYNPSYDGFEDTLKECLKCVSSHYLDYILTPKNIARYKVALTSSTADIQHNYEALELIGDAAANHALVSYMTKRFPQFICPTGVQILARLKINYASKKTFSKFGEHMGLWPYIRATVEERNEESISLLEDSFEAFIGLTETIGNEEFLEGVGYGIIYKVVECNFNWLNINIKEMKYSDFVDAKTRFKELADKFFGPGTAMYRQIESSDDDVIKFGAYLKGYESGKILGIGQSSTKQEAQQDAAEKAIATLSNGPNPIVNPVPEAYTMFDIC